MTDNQHDIPLDDSELANQWLFHQAPVGLGILNRDGVILQLNSAAQVLFQPTDLPLEGRRIQEFLSFEDRSLFTQFLHDVFQGSEARQSEVTFLRSDRQPFQARICFGTPIREHSAVIVSILEPSLPSGLSETAPEIDLESRTLVNSASDAIITFNDHDTIEMANPAAEVMFGYLPLELIGKNISQLIASLGGTIPVQTDLSIHRFLVHKGILKTGHSFPVEVAISESTHGNRRLYTAIIRDQGPRMQLEDRFRKIQQMQVVGQLAGGIAHDFNNLLTIINGYSQMLLDQGTLKTNEMDLIQLVRNAGERAATITHQLLAFSGKQYLSVSVVDLNNLLAAIRPDLERNLSDLVQCTISSDPHLWKIKGDAKQIERILLALVANAQDAMPKGGSLTIETTNVDVKADQGTHELPSGSYAVLSIRDTGTGMTPEVIDRLFEPFFTTKPIGKGTGLALAMIHGTVTQMGGYILVNSQPGKGSCFQLYFPGVEVNVSPSKQSHPGPAKPNAVILIAEDDPRIRKFLEMSLSGCGYTILSSSDGLDAIRVASQQVGPIHLLITDVNMPGMNGFELLERIRCTRPDLPAICISGYPDAGKDLPEALARGNIAFMAKPFSPSSLVSKVEEWLNRR